MWKTIGIVIIVLIAGVLGFATTKPDSFRAERSATIKAPPEKVFAILDDFKRWDAWSPWEKKDPAMKRTFGPVTRGKGAVYEWDGNSEVGKGRMEIAESTPSSRIVIKLDFIKPFEGHNIVNFRLEPVADGTKVNWSIEGPLPYISKVISIFCDMDSMIGKDFEAGLASLKTLAEK